MKAKKKKDLRITTDCVCDLPFGILEENDVDIIFFHIVTENGRFYDRDEITAENVFEHMENGGYKAETEMPSVQEYVDFFRKNLRKYERIIHITISGSIGDAYKNAQEAVLRMGYSGERVSVIDSETISTGMGLLVLRAAEMNREGQEAGTIIRELEAAKKKVSTTFIVHDALYFYLNDKVKLFAVKMAELFQMHPVMKIENGKIKLKYILFGQYPKAVRRYVRWQLRGRNRINRKRAFLTHTACNVKTLSMAKSEAETFGRFEELIVTKASATVSSSCGPDTLGILFFKA